MRWSGVLKQRQGAEQLGKSERGFRKLLKRCRAKQDAAVAHVLRGRRSNRGVNKETAQRAVAAVRQRYRDFGPALAGEYLEKDLQIKLSHETLRRAFRELGIEWIAAQPPQAKGRRIERSFQTLQDRLVKGLRMAGTSSLEEPNEYLEKEFLPEWERRSTAQAASEVDAHRPLGATLHLASTLSLVEQRQVSDDYTLAWQGEHWQIPKEAVRAGLRRSSVRVESRLDGSRVVRMDGRFYALRVCQKAEKVASKQKQEPRRYVPPPGQRRWMDNFRVEGNPAWKAYRQEAATVSAPLRSPSGLPARS
jgi:transposase